MYTDQMTDKEKRLGFKLAQMPNPEARNLFQKKYIQAVVYELDPDNVIIKEVLPPPLEGVRYTHQHRDHDEWRAAENEEFDPETAVRNATAYLRQLRPR
jgi:hypothetical protein